MIVSAAPKSNSFVCSASSFSFSNNSHNSFIVHPILQLSVYISMLKSKQSAVLICYSTVSKNQQKVQVGVYWTEEVRLHKDLSLQSNNEHFVTSFVWCVTWRKPTRNKCFPAFIFFHSCSKRFSCSLVWTNLKVALLKIACFLLGTKRFSFFQTKEIFG